MNIHKMGIIVSTAFMVAAFIGLITKEVSIGDYIIINLLSLIYQNTIYKP